GKTVPAFSGQQTWRGALQKLLMGSGLEWGLVNDTTVVIRRSGNAAKPAASQHKQTEKADQKPEPTTLQGVTVMASRNPRNVVSRLLALASMFSPMTRIQAGSSPFLNLRAGLSSNARVPSIA